MKLILINGQPGTGKSTVAETLKNETAQSAFIDADNLVAVNPLDFDKDEELMLENAVPLIDNFSRAGFITIVTAGLTKNQKRLNQFLKEFRGNADIVFVWLRADREIRKLEN